MKTHVTRRIPLAAAVCLALAALALGFPASASPDAPNPGHSWSEIGDLPGTMWHSNNHGSGSGLDADTLDGLDSTDFLGGSFWSLTGNSGTTPGTNFLGTTDNQALELRVNGARALRLEPTSDEPNLIGGYSGNSVTSGVIGATIGGGGASQALTNRVTDDYGTVAGGAGNLAGDDFAPTDSEKYATVGGGLYNTASGNSSTVGGGWNNTAGDIATVGGGFGNSASGNVSTVGGGQNNTASSNFATIGGGLGNSANSESSAVGGGDGNTASGYAATVPGGESNTAQGYYSFAAGHRAKANHHGAFVWADSNDFDFASTAIGEFSARTTGGARFVLAIDGSGNPTWTCSVANGGTWSCSSARALKENLVAADGRDILERLSDVPVFTWNAKSQDDSIRHIGPMAEDFYAAFGVGEDDGRLSTIDLDGVALAAIQGLYELSQEQGARIEALEEENATLQQRLDDLDARVMALEGGANSAQAGLLSSGLPSTWLLLGGGLALALGGLVLVQRRVAGGRR